MLKKDLKQLRKLLQQYAAEVLEEECNEDNMELVSYANKIKNIGLIIGEVEYIRSVKEKQNA